MPTENASDYNQLLENISNELDIPPSKFQQAKERYIAVGKWLEEGDYAPSTEQPEIYVQGSFSIGTVVRPIKDGEESDYDIDLVCQLSNRKESTPPNQIKRMVGDRLKENGKYEGMLEPEGKRCWTLDYAEEDGIGFHMDILPSVDEDLENKNEIKTHPLNEFPRMADHAISITHKDESGNYSSPSSNPKGYAEWFTEINKPTFDSIKTRGRQSVFEKNKTLYATVDEVPDQLVKTPLQRAIQILKRHRDERFTDDPWESDKPISMIITTLAAKVYQGEPDIFSTLESVINNLTAYSPLLDSELPLRHEATASRLIERKQSGKWDIPNPVNPMENFADRWHENNNRKAKAFFRWVSWLRRDFVQVLDQGEIKTIGEALQGVFGESIIQKASKGLYIAGAPSIGERIAQPDYHVEIKEPTNPWYPSEQFR